MILYVHGLDYTTGYDEDGRHYELNEILGTEKIEIVSSGYKKAKALWKGLGNIPTDDDGYIEEPFLDFGIGTDREEIWSWFEEEFDLSVAEDLMYCNGRK